jgi:hypothetical protein
MALASEITSALARELKGLFDDMLVAWVHRVEVMEALAKAAQERGEAAADATPEVWGPSRRQLEAILAWCDEYPTAKVMSEPSPTMLLGLSKLRAFLGNQTREWVVAENLFSKGDLLDLEEAITEVCRLSSGMGMNQRARLRGIRDKIRRVAQDA